MAQIFLSHTRLDSGYCDYFDSICARVGIRAFRSELEAITPPAWSTINFNIRASAALFLLVGRELVAKQVSHGNEWEYTQNWIAYEIGVASQLGTPVWICVDEDITINFPVPFASDYIIGRREDCRPYLREALNYYNQIIRIGTFGGELAITCPYDDCQLTFRFHTALAAGEQILCPQCLRGLSFANGWPPQQATA